MSLSRHIDPDEVIQKSKDHPQTGHRLSHEGRAVHQSWSRDEDAAGVPKYRMPDVGIPSKAAYQLLHDETALDGNPLLNLASFVHTWMPDEATKLIMENINKNQVDLDEYPAATMIHNRCVSMGEFIPLYISHRWNLIDHQIIIPHPQSHQRPVASLWKAPTASTNAIGTSTAGSSEAIMLAGLALKKRWQNARRAADKPSSNPNIVFGSNAQVALEKFARYFDVECRLVPVKASNNYVMDPKDALAFIDENTIGVMVILGSTYTGHFENVKEMSELRALRFFSHAASGGFIAPFAYPSLQWSFDVPRVVSINTSGHKFGLVYAGIGWVIWRDEQYLSKDLVFELRE
ncbi:PLP-dependent transferase [Dendrothele bispora CBS 962.96]|uniref:glutamate decarboxylase n=1 Tax=Dendrothele bispora (strain CBS 962.96) TaxID=1314807 RepID=A0A4V4HIL6_DENBC|nr:PLP-dependent transferase [Dendrothele bispora CBS 962.96]